MIRQIIHHKVGMKLPHQLRLLYSPKFLGIGFSLVMVILIYVGFFYNQMASAQDYTVRGFDVSHHQGNIDWAKISPQKFQFVYLKATEGGDFQDPKFQENWLKAREYHFHVGAYHFYRLCRDGKTQAENFIATVPKKIDALPPVIDLEYDANCINTYTKEQLLEQIKVTHDLLKAHYGKQPIFYVSKNFYHIVLMGSFQNAPLWIRDYDGKPELKDDRQWLFWQYTSKSSIKGIEKPVDLNVYAGSLQHWQQFVNQKSQVANTVK